MSKSKQLTDKQSEAVRRALRLLIKKLGSQARVVEVTGLSGATLSNMLSGKTGAGMLSAEKIAAALGVTVAEMLRIDDKTAGQTAIAIAALPPGGATQWDEFVDPETIPVLQLSRPRSARTDIELVDRYASRAVVVKSLEGVYPPQVLEALLLEAAHGEDPGEAYWRSEAERIFLEREKARHVVRKAREQDFSMLGSPENPDE